MDTKICGCSKIVGIYFDYVGSHLWVFKMCEYSKFIDTQTLWALKFVGTRNLWVLKVCDATKFQVDGGENQNICVFCISCKQKNICAFSIYSFCHMCKNIPSKLGFKQQMYGLGIKGKQSHTNASVA